MIKNIFWDFVGRFGYMVVTFLVSIVLTRLLSPTEYGIMGMAMVIIGVAVIFYDLGFSKAIVQSKEINKLQLSTIFYINIVLATSLTLICFFIAGPLAAFYQQPLIKPVFRVLSLTFILNALSLIPSSMLYREMKFRAISIFNLTAISISGIIGIMMAYNGFGVWSLVAQTLSYSIILAGFYFLFYKWMPHPAFNLKSVRPLWQYGSRLLATSFMELTFARLDSFIIGKIFSIATLGFYSRAQTLENMVRQLSINSFMTVLFPVIAQNQYNRTYLSHIYKKYLHIICFIAFGLTGILFLTAQSLFVILFGKQWAFSGELFQLMAAAVFIYPLNAIMCNFITGMGSSKSYLRLEMVKKLVLVPVYLLGFFWGLKWFIIIFVIAHFLNLIVAAFFLRRDLDISVSSHFQIIIKYLGITIITILFTYLTFQLNMIENVYFDFFSKGILFLLIYLIAAHFTKLKGKILFLEIIQPKLSALWKYKFTPEVK